MNREQPIKAAPKNCAKFPMTRPLTGKVVSCWDEGGVFLGEGIGLNTVSSGGGIAINGKVYDSNNVLLWCYAVPQAKPEEPAFKEVKIAELWECTDCGHLYDGEISLCDCHGPNAHKLKKYRATLVEVE